MKDTERRGAIVSDVRSDEERVTKLIERLRLLLAVDEEIPVATKLDMEPLLDMLEAAIRGGDSSDQRLAADYHRRLYSQLSPCADLEALLSAMQVFVPYLR